MNKDIDYSKLRFVYASGDTPATVDMIVSCLPAGWKPRVITLIDDLLAEGWDGRLEACKIVSGSLFFDVAYRINSEMDLIIEEVEAELEFTCEKCGHVGQPVLLKGVTHALCNSHMKDGIPL